MHTPTIKDNKPDIINPIIPKVILKRDEAIMTAIIDLLRKNQLLN
ncbi:MAG: hypothetical protein SVR08_06855 [Spirochaetota bacterium]|nr:hypothetical protein [Spirochaetota bacterium]